MLKILQLSPEQARGVMKVPVPGWDALACPSALTPASSIVVGASTNISVQGLARLVARRGEPAVAIHALRSCRESYVHRVFLKYI
jgi:hypothetical protein